MNSKKWLDVLTERDYRLSLGAETTAASLLLAEICRISPEGRHGYLEQFITDNNGEMKVDREALLQELYRLAEETGEEVSGMELSAGTGFLRQQTAAAKSQLSTEKFAVLKNTFSPGFMRFLTDLYKNL